MIRKSKTLRTQHNRHFDSATKLPAKDSLRFLGLNRTRSEGPAAKRKQRRKDGEVGCVKICLNLILFVGVCLLLSFIGVFIHRFGRDISRSVYYNLMINRNPYNLEPEEYEQLIHTYSKIAEEEPYRNIPIKYAPELDTIIKEMRTLFQVIPTLNLTKVFFNGTLDSKLQSQANRSNLTGEEFTTLHFYESVRSVNDPTTQKSIKKKLYPRYGKYRDYFPRRYTATFGDKKQWDLRSGRLVHKRIDEMAMKFYIDYRIKVTGLFYYPPGGYAEWHTNRYDLSGWRLYYIWTAEPGKSWFRYKLSHGNVTGKHEGDKIIHVAPDGKEHLNVFRISKGVWEDKNDRLLWHSVYSDTHRFSVGFNVPSTFVYLILSRYLNATT